MHGKNYIKVRPPLVRHLSVIVYSYKTSIGDKLSSIVEIILSTKPLKKRHFLDDFPPNFFPNSRTTSWRSGYCYLNKGECNLNQSKHDSFVERVAKNNSWNNRDRHKIHEIFLINCFVFVITPVWKTVRNSAMTQTKAHLMEKTLQLTVPR